MALFMGMPDPRGRGGKSGNTIGVGMLTKARSFENDGGVPRGERLR